MKRVLGFGFWQWVFVALMGVAAYATFLRFCYGLGAVTNLNDQFPWGIWIGFDVLCGVGLAAGGFTLAATVHLFNLERFKPVVRPAILTAFMGYLLVIVALLFDLGRPYRIWHPIIMWNPRSVMFEVAWCVTLYTTVLGLEFAPVLLERFKMTRTLKLLKGVMIPLVIAGVILSTLHQSSLGSLYLIMPQKLHPLWYSPLLPVLFFLSAVAVGLAMTIFESWHSAKAFGKQLELPLVRRLAQVLAVVIGCYLTVRFLDLWRRKAFASLEQPGPERWLFVLEILLMAVPMLLLLRQGVRRNPYGLYISSVLFLLGFVAHRLNVSVTGLETALGVKYVPKWTEIGLTFALVAAGFAIFRLAARHLPIFEETVESHQAGGGSREAAWEPALARGD
jgi:Ni/Fe-hydrogenase subunit HybB-like protein